MKIGPSLGVNAPLLRIEDERAGEVGGEQVGRELDAPEGRLDRIGHGLDRERLGQPGNALEEQVAVREEADRMRRIISRWPTIVPSIALRSGVMNALSSRTRAVRSSRLSSAGVIADWLRRRAVG